MKLGACQPVRVGAEEAGSDVLTVVARYDRIRKGGKQFKRPRIRQNESVPCIENEDPTSIAPTTESRRLVPVVKFPDSLILD